MLPQVDSNLTLFDKSPCIRPVWDPGSASGVVLSCLGRTEKGKGGKSESQERVRWRKVSTLHCVNVGCV